MLDHGRDARGAGVVEAAEVEGGEAEVEGGGIQKAVLGAEGVMGEALAEGQGEEGEQDAVDHDVPAVGVAGVDGFDVPAEGAAAKGAQAPELGAAEVPARLGEAFVAEGTLEGAVQVDAFADGSALGEEIGVADRREFHRGEEAVGVPGEEEFEGGAGIGVWRAHAFGEGHQGGEGSGRPQRQGERVDVTGEVVARGRFGQGEGGVNVHGTERCDRGGG